MEFHPSQIRSNKDKMTKLSETVDKMQLWDYNTIIIRIEVSRIENIDVNEFTGQIQRITAMAELASRMNVGARMGMQYSGERDIAKALGYQQSITYDDLLATYIRQDIAKAIVDRPVKSTWRGDFTVIEPHTEEDTPFEAGWEEMYRKLAIKQSFLRVDKLASLGNYALLFLGFNDVNSPDALINPVSKGVGRELLYLKPFGQNVVAIKEWDRDTSSPEYGAPKIYQVNIGDSTSKEGQTVNVHKSRIVHVAFDLLDSEYEGAPVLEAVYNRLKDLEKLVGGSAEMFWRGARPGYAGKIDPEYMLTKDTEEGLKRQLDEFEHNLRRVLMLEGVTLDSLEPQVVDPSMHVDIQIQMISAVTGIPKRILTGSERGDLASTQDKDNWLDLIQMRREEYAEPKIVRATIDRCIEFGVLPPPEKETYKVKWQDLYAPSVKDQATIGQIRAIALKNFTYNPEAEQFIPFEAFLTYFLGLEEEEVEYIKKLQKTSERILTPELKEIADENAPTRRERPPRETPSEDKVAE